MGGIKASNTGGGAATVADAIRATALAAGLSNATVADVARLDLVNGGASANRIDILDAVRIARNAAGLEANP